MIRLATIGTSTITERFASAVAAVEGIRIEVVHSRDRARGEEFAARIEAPAAETDLPALLGADRVDAVYIGSPNGVHAEQAAAAIAAGKHVFVEKPAVAASAGWDQLRAHARAAGVVILEGMRHLYDPGFTALRDLVPEVGVVRRASFALCQRSARYALVLAGEMPNIFNPALSGGALLDLGVYPLSALIALFGEPLTVAAASVPVATGADGLGTALLGYEGFYGEAAYSKISFSDRPSEIQGESGTLTIDRIDRPRELILTRLDGTVVHRRIEGPEDNMRYEVARFVELVGGADPEPDQEGTAVLLRTLERIRAAS